MTTPFTAFSPGHYAAGQPTPAELEACAHKGVRTIINLRGADETIGFDEAAVAAGLGLRYVVLPISGAVDLDRSRVERFGQLLDEARQSGDVLIHCASANRVGALVALDQALNRGLPRDQALALGRRAGLMALEPAVVALCEREGAR